MAGLTEKFRYIGRFNNAYIFCRGSDTPVAFLRGVAALLPAPAHLLEVRGDYLERADRAPLIDPLLRGEWVVILSRGRSTLCDMLVSTWTKATRHTTRLGGERHGSYHGNLGPNVSLNFTVDATTQPGRLVIVQVGGENYPGLAGERIYIDDDADIRTLEAAGSGAEPLRTVGRYSRAGGTGLTIERLYRELCLLHARDEQPMQPLDDKPLSVRTAPLAWRDIQRLLVPEEPWRDDEIQEMYARGLVDREKLDFYLAAHDELYEQRLPDRILSCVWEAVWVYQALEREGQFFRGQASDKWRLDSTLLRLSPGADALSTGVLERRLRLTDAFLCDLRGRQDELLGTTLNEDELFAIAQHYGVPNTSPRFHTLSAGGSVLCDARSPARVSRRSHRGHPLL